jgi:hypothetical protein
MTFLSLLLLFDDSLEAAGLAAVAEDDCGDDDTPYNLTMFG